MPCSSVHIYSLANKGGQKKKHKGIQREEINKKKEKERKENRMIDWYKQHRDELELLQYNFTLQNYKHILHSI